MNSRPNTVNVKKRIILASVCILLTVFQVIGGVLYAKYVQGEKKNIVASSPNFYFDSDYLTKTNAEYTLNADTESVTFRLRNYADSLRYSDDEIAFSVTVECLTVPAPDVPAVLSLSHGSIPAGSPNEVAITLSGLKSGYTYRVVAVGDAGFRETLGAVFTVHDTDKCLYKHLAVYDEYVILTVWTRDLEGRADIAFPADLIPDNTWPQMATASTASGEFSVDYSKYTSYNFRFFKNLLSDSFSVTDFDVRIGETEALISTPS